MLKYAFFGLIYLFLFPISPIYGQWGLGLDYHYGQFLKHNKSQIFPIYDPVHAITLDIMKQTQGSEYWSRIHGYPRAGVGLIYKSYGNDSVLGKGIGAFPQIDIWLLSREKFRIYTRLGFGLIYITKPFDRVTNTKNNTIGTHFNNYTTLGIQAEYNVNPRLRLHLGGELSHSSNGHFRFPNLGMNTATASMGLHYQMQATQTFDTLQVTSYKPSRKILFGLRVGLGGKEANVAESPIYRIYTLTPHIIFPRSGKSQWSTGVEFTYDTYLKEFFDNIQASSNEGIWRVSVFGAHEWLWGRFAFPLQLHFYADKPFQGSDFYYTKLGPKIYLLPPHKHPRRNLYSAVTLKANGVIADYVEICVGGTF